MNSLAWMIFVAAAVLEVGGDAVIRKGLRGDGALFIAVGAAMLAIYGVTINQVKWDFSMLMGVYVTIFATTSVMIGRFYFKEAVPASTWLGLGFIVVGGLIIQFSSATNLPQ